MAEALTPEQLQEQLKNMSPEELQEFQKQQCIFCKISAGKVPGKVAYQDKDCLAVLDINPAVPGHLLLFPREHYAILPQMPDHVVAHLFAVAQVLSRDLLKKLRADGTTLLVANGLAAGQRAQHVLLHLIPRKEQDGVLSLEEKWISEQEREKIQKPLTHALNGILGISQEKVPAAKEEERKEPEPSGKAKISEKKTRLSPKKEEKEKKEESVSLDDIARLFT